MKKKKNYQGTQKVYDKFYKSIQFSDGVEIFLLFNMRKSCRLIFYIAFENGQEEGAGKLL